MAYIPTGEIEMAAKMADFIPKRRQISKISEMAF
jgi:hypothetical protein